MQNVDFGNCKAIHSALLGWRFRNMGVDLTCSIHLVGLSAVHDQEYIYICLNQCMHVYDMHIVPAYIYVLCKSKAI